MSHLAWDQHLVFVKEIEKGNFLMCMKMEEDLFVYDYGRGLTTNLKF